MNSIHRKFPLFTTVLWTVAIMLYISSLHFFIPPDFRILGWLCLEKSLLWCLLNSDLGFFQFLLHNININFSLIKSYLFSFVSLIELFISIHIQKLFLFPFKNHFLIIHWMLKTNIMPMTSSVFPRNFSVRDQKQLYGYDDRSRLRMLHSTMKMEQGFLAQIERELRANLTTVKFKQRIVLELKWTPWGECILSRRKR